MTALTLGPIGSPSSGKTTSFNQLAGSRQRIGNWAGVAVEHKEDAFHTARHTVHLVDLPGAYSLTSVSAQVSLDEQTTCRYITSDEIDMLIDVVGMTNLGRNLYLTMQLREMSIPCIVAPNMLGITHSQRVRIDIDGLARRLGCPIVPLASTRANSADELKATIDSLQLPQAAPVMDCPSVTQVQAGYLLETHAPAVSAIEPRQLALQALEGDIFNGLALDLPPTVLEQARQGHGEEPELAIVDARYRLIGEICAAVRDHQ